MKAYLLAAGLGTRSRPLTRDIPKCLVPIKGKPLLAIWLQPLEQHGVTEVLINTHYHADKVISFLEQYKGPIRVRTVYEKEPLGSAGTLRENREFIRGGEPFFILYADNLTRIDLTGMLRFYREHPAPLLMALFHAPVPQNCGIAALGEGSIITGFVEKPAHPASDLANAGIYIADSSLFDYLPPSGPADLGYDVLPKLIGRMKGYVFSEYLLDIGTLDAYHRAQEEWQT
ncbi:nucleotidyltransferase family protein [Paenibacillus sp. P26]|nr:nucleotidyltransferase family protein [Paenibacillus sp. P26]